MQKLKIALSLFLCTVILTGSTLFQTALAAGSSTAAYVALGDSITAGYGLSSFTIGDAKNKSSENNFVIKLGKKLGKKALNFGVEGIDTSILLKSISKPFTSEEKSTVEQIKKASLITLSIGGNNVLWPLLDALNEKVGSGKTIFNADEIEIQSAVLGLLFDTEALSRLQKNVAAGAERFTGNVQLKKTGEFSEIISTLKKLNPKVKIIVQTVYNPYGIFMPQSVDSAIKSMNAQIIKGSANGKNYLVADVYAAFSAVAPGTKLVNADSGTSFDPHPTAKGHEVIYTLVAYAAQNNTLPYKVNANITKGTLAAKIINGQLVLTVTPAAGYKLPENILLTVGKGQKRTLILKNGTASVPVADVNADIHVSGVCSR